MGAGAAMAGRGEGVGLCHATRAAQFWRQKCRRLRQLSERSAGAGERAGLVLGAVILRQGIAVADLASRQVEPALFTAMAGTASRSSI